MEIKKIPLTVKSALKCYALAPYSSRTDSYLTDSLIS